MVNKKAALVKGQKHQNEIVTRFCEHCGIQYQSSDDSTLLCPECKKLFKNEETLSMSSNQSLQILNVG